MKTPRPSSPAVQMKLTRRIFIGVAAGSTSLYAAFTASVLVAVDLGLSRAWAGVPGAAAILGTALGSTALSRVMAARGRRAGLLGGWVIGAVGASVAIVAVIAGSFPGLVGAMVLIGIGHASNQLSRFAAADMHPEHRRPAVLGWVVWAGTVGAILGPSLLGPAEAIGRILGTTILTSGFLVALVFFVLAIGAAGSLRPDPSELADRDEALVRVRTRFRDHWQLGRVKLALVILITGQFAMTAIMTMTPLHVREHGHGVGVIGLVMSAHFVGMFGFAPLIGIWVARFGSVRVALAGLGMLIAAALGAAFSPVVPMWWIAAILFALGVGWCLTFVSGSALLTGGLPYAQRVRLQGGVDAAVWTTSAIASLASGILVAASGFATLALVGAAFAAGALIVVGIARPRLAAAAATAQS